VVTAADEDTALAVDVLPGQAGDAPQLHRMLDRTEERVPVEEVVGDKAFDGDAPRAGCLDRGIHTVIPNKANRVDPWPFDEVAYRERNRIERLFAKLKQFRRVATRYEKLKVTFLGMVHLALGFIRLRKSVNVNTP
jgi:transposase